MRALLLILTLCLVAPEMSSAQDQPNPLPLTAAPPVAEKRPKVTEIHGRRMVDDYYWLREKQNPEVAAYLEAENRYAEAVLAPTKGLQEQLYQEMLGRIKQTDLSPPYRMGDFFYYSRTEEGKQYPIYARRRGSLDAPEELLLDLNELAKGKPFMALGAFTVSDDGNLLAYSTDSTGFRQYTLRVKDLRTGALLPTRVEKTVSVAWAGDNRTLFYTVQDDAKRPYRLYRHRTGGDGEDALVYEERDEMFNLYPFRTRSKQYVMLGIGSHTTSEVRYLAADRPEGEWRVVSPRKAGREYDVDHHGDRFYIRVNDAGRNFRLVTAPVADPSDANWKEVIPHRADVMLEGIDLFANHAVLYEREDGLPRLRVDDLRTGASHRIELPEPVYSAGPYANPEWNVSSFRFSYQSFVTPSSIFEYDMDRRERRLLKQTEVLGGYDPARYASERVYATADDGTRIPISLVYRKDVPRDGSAPLYLYAYGSYGYPSNVYFSSNRLSMLDRGVVYALAHIRGGGDLGKTWHDDGRMMKKMNTFTDFIDAAEALVEQRYTSKDRIIIEGGSAGGLLMGAVANMRPDLFRVVVSHVPFVDVMNTMLDASLPLTVGEYEEWGNPNDQSAFEYMIRYSPYDNVRPDAYPAMLVKTSFNDSQVMYWEPAKYVAKLRAMKTDRNPLLLVTNMGAGHGGASGRYDRLREIALDYAFMLSQVGIME